MFTNTGLDMCWVNMVNVGVGSAPQMVSEALIILHIFGPHQLFKNTQKSDPFSDIWFYISKLGTDAL